ncbi:energy-coupling factor ABC transporter ATP-binding protein [Fructobacillus sp. M1-13]|uniref:ABC transporter ATP-binding protein n=1 Tax=Fructobacillus papyriferae TaxID=2713171 RepID=A0ABS5QRS4_9LACO|nr:ABC transporter ATP-binding protein [Fructobacillus papyriferae]MBS9334662.1 ABC transporter ATP-binding protein [Fructobacillus papyriferae]MCD2158652.1 energy-coupling factor ABC transporter ATP-binding protein [Fructobacillus papyriferae]
MTLRVENVHFTYRKKTLFSDVSMDITTGDFILLMGPSGSGKSTLLKTIAGLYPQYGGKVTGRVTINGQALSDIPANQRTKVVGLLFQNPHEQFAMKTVEEELLFTMENLQLAPETMSEKIDQNLAKVGLTGFRKRVLSELSGGELQKVALAEVLVTGAKYLLLDEPFAAIDPGARKDLQQLLKSLANDGYAILISDHDDQGYVDKMTAFYQIQKQQLVKVAQEDWPKPVDRQVITVRKETVGQPIFQVKQMVVENDQRLLIRQAQLKIKAGECTLITGPNGSGKSSFLRTLARLQEAEGQFVYLDQDFHRWKKKDYYRQVTLAFQNALDQFLNITVEEELLQVQKNTYQKNYWSAKRIERALQALGLEGLGNRSVYTLSGGQQKKLQLLLLLVMASPVLLLDEPFAGLDEQSVQAVLALFEEVRRKLNVTLLIVSHQVGALAPLVNRHLALENAQFVDKEKVAI